MGTVYRGAHVKTGQRVAIKVLARQMSQEPRFRRRFDAEIETLKNLNHPNIVRLIGFGEEQGLLFYSMELVEGPSLLEHLRKVKRLDWDTVLGIGIDVCAALKHAHDFGVIHRDLKPANLLMEPEGRLKLTDFGIAKLFGANEQTAAGSVLGTADYMAPEQAAGGNVTPRTDLYALGSLLYACLVGRPPFGGRNLTQVIHGLKHESPVPLDLVVPDVPHELAELVHELLEKAPEDRPPTALAVGKRLASMRVGLHRRGELTQLDPDRPTVSGALPSSGEAAPYPDDLSDTDRTLDGPTHGGRRSDGPTVEGSGLNPIHSDATRDEGGESALTRPGYVASGPDQPTISGSDSDIPTGSGIETGEASPERSPAAGYPSPSHSPAAPLRSSSTPRVSPAEPHSPPGRPSPPGRVDAGGRAESAGWADAGGRADSAGRERQDVPPPKTRFEAVPADGPRRRWGDSAEPQRDPWQWASIGGLLLLLITMVGISLWMLRKPDREDLLAAIAAAESAGDPQAARLAREDFLRLYPHDPSAETLRETQDLSEVEQMARKLRGRALRFGGVEMLDPAQQSWLKAIEGRDQFPHAAADRLRTWLDVFGHPAALEGDGPGDNSLIRLSELTRREVERLDASSEAWTDPRTEQLAAWLRWGREHLDGSERERFFKGLATLYEDEPWAAPVLEQLPD